MRSRLTKVALVVMLAGAFVIRLAYILKIKNLAIYYHPFLDSAFFNDLAHFKRSVAWVDAALPFREPLYGFLVASFYSIFKESLTLIRVIQGIFGTISVGLVYLIARRTYGELAGIISGFLFALFIPAIFFTAEINEAGVVAMLILLGLYLLEKPPAGTRPAHILGSGIVLGFAYLGRITAAGALVGSILGAATGKSAKRSMVLVIVGIAIPIVLYQTLLLENDRGTLVPLRSGWYAFLGAGNDGSLAKNETQTIEVGRSDEKYPVIVSTDRVPGQRDASRLAAIEIGKKVSSSEANRHWWRRAVAKLSNETRSSISSYLKRFGMILGASQPPSNFDMRFVARFSGILRTHIFTFSLVAPLGLLGLVLLRRRQALPVTISIAAMITIASIFPVSDIDKFLIASLLTIPAGGLTAFVIDTLRSRHLSRGLLYIALAVGLGIVLALFPRAKLDEPSQLVLLGDLYAEASLYGKAEDAYRQAIAQDPDLPQAYVSLARLYGNTGKSEKATTILDQALSRNIDDPRIRIEKASLLVLLNRAPEAKADLLALQEIYPYQPRVRELMGLCLLSEKDAQSAIEELNKEMEYGGGGFVTYAALGRAYFAIENYSEAAKYLEQALNLNPLSTAVTSLAMLLADAYTKLEYHYKACDVLSRIARVDPGNMPVRFKLANCLYRAGRLDESLKEFEQLHKFDPTNADILVNMGTVYADMDSLDRAIKVWKEALKLDPNNDLARENLKRAKQ